MRPHPCCERFPFRWSDNSRVEFWKAKTYLKSNHKRETRPTRILGIEYFGENVAVSSATPRLGVFLVLRSEIKDYI